MMRIRIRLLAAGVFHPHSLKPAEIAEPVDELLVSRPAAGAGWARRETSRRLRLGGKRCVWSLANLHA